MSICIATNDSNTILTCHCPYSDCNIAIEVAEINCAIFRCGIYKHSGKQIDPHLSKEECDRIKKEDKIWGCGRPFKLVNGKLIECNYI
jgi:hypothetical protein